MPPEEPEVNPPNPESPLLAEPTAKDYVVQVRQRHDPISLILSLAALAVSLGTLFYASAQVSVGRRLNDQTQLQLDLQQKQLEIGKTQQQQTQKQVAIQENELKLTKEQQENARTVLLIQQSELLNNKKNLEMAMKQFADSYANDVIILSESLKVLRSPLTDRKRIRVQFQNFSKHPVSYRVLVAADGFGVYWPDQEPPSTLRTAIFLDENAILIGPDAVYTGEFIVVHGVEKYNNASLTIYVGDNYQLKLHYDYDANAQAYVFKRL